VFKIGEFSRLVRVSVRMLRHYEKCGLLFPVETDKFTGYRQYAAEQIPLARSIVTLRDLGFSIAEIGEALPRLDDPSFMRDALNAKASQVRSAIETEQGKLKRIIQMRETMRKECKPMVYDVELKTLPAQTVISLRAVIPKYNEEGALWARLGRFVGENRVPCHSDGYSTYYDEEYKESDVDVEIAIPVDAVGADSGEIKYKEYPAIPLAATVRFTGAFDSGYDAASGKLAAWMEANGYAFAGPLRGHVLTSPDDDPNPEKWETELQAPVMKA